MKFEIKCEETEPQRPVEWLLGKMKTFGDADIEELVLGAGVDESTKSRNNIGVERNDESVLIGEGSGIETGEPL